MQRRHEALTLETVMLSRMKEAYTVCSFSSFLNSHWTLSVFFVFISSSIFFFLLPLRIVTFLPLI